MRTALGRVRGLGSAKKGTGDFVASRLTSVALLAPTVALIYVLASSVGRPYAEVVARLSSPWVAILLLAFILLNAAHMRLGMQIIIEDYIHTDLQKFALLAGNWLFSWGLGLASAYAVLKIAFGT
jgi:succinate dehydrogenase / fumarate reductase, membrane anchor subunit